MILPSKHIPEDEALISVGAALLANLERPRTVSGLWEKLRKSEIVGNFERFVFALDLLCILGAVVVQDGLIQKAPK